MNEPEDRCDGSRLDAGDQIVFELLLRACFAAPSNRSSTEDTDQAPSELAERWLGDSRVVSLPELTAALHRSANLGALQSARVLLLDDCEHGLPARSSELLQRFLDERDPQSHVALLSNRPLCDLAQLFSSRTLHSLPIGRTGWCFVQFSPHLSTSACAASPSPTIARQRESD